MNQTLTPRELRVRTWQDAEDFVREFLSSWLNNEDEDAAFLRLGRFPPKPDSTYLCVTNERNEPLQTACVVSSDQIIFTRADSDVLECLAAHLVKNDITFPGLFAPHPQSREFASIYSRLSGRNYRVVKQQIHFQLANLKPVSTTPCKVRQATLNDRANLIEFRTSSQAEGNTQRPFDSAKSVDADLANETIYVLENEDSQIVCSASIHLLKSPHSGYIDNVYTLPNERNQGYSTHLVHEVCRIIHDLQRVARLSTDATNAPAIRSYEKVGFVAKCRMDNMRLQ